MKTMVKGNMKILINKFNVNIKIIVLITSITILVTHSTISFQKNNKKSEHIKKQKIIVKMMFDTISTFPEIKQLNNLAIDSNSHYGFHLISEPNNKDSFYWIQYGVNDIYRFNAIYNFIVYKEKNSIIVKYYDSVADSIISIDDWRQNR